MRPHRLRIGIDMDQVTADFHAGWTKEYVRSFGGPLIPRETITDWDGLVGVTKFAAMSQFWAWVRSDCPRLFRDLPPVDGALEVLEDLRCLGHDVVIITARPSWARSDTLTWLGTHGIAPAEVHFTHHKAGVFPCDVYLDDGPEYLEALSRAYGDRSTVVRYVRPWNRPQPWLVDANDWQEFANVVSVVCESAVLA